MMWPRHQPIEEHTDRGEVLFDGGFRMRAAELLDIRRNVHRRHPAQISQTFIVTQCGESLGGFGATDICNTQGPVLAGLSASQNLPFVRREVDTREAE
jgi:hypothetical protein